MRRTLPWAVALLGLVLVGGGVALFLTGEPTGGVGWAAYAPLAPVRGAYDSGLRGAFADGPAVLWTRTAALGAGIAVLGLLWLAGLVGWLTGVRAGRNAGR